MSYIVRAAMPVTSADSVVKVTVSTVISLCAALWFSRQSHKGIREMGISKKMVYVTTLLMTVLTAGKAIAQTTYNFEYDRQVTEQTTIQALKDDLFGDKISFEDGGVQFNVTDVTAKSQVNLPVVFGRRMTPERSSTGWTIKGLPDITKDTLGRFWSPDVPVISGIYPTDAPFVTGSGPRCSSGNLVPQAISLYPITGPGGTLLPYNFWSGVTANIPQYGSEKLIVLNDGAQVPSDGADYKFVTSSNWRISCLASIKNGTGEGFVVHLPDGAKYYFDWMGTRQETRLYVPITDNTGVTVFRTSVFFFASKAVDRFGNTVTYTYDPQNPTRLLKIAASDGAEISIAYDQDGRVSAVTTGGRTWRYTYSADPNWVGNAFLTKVALPDSSSWDYEYTNNVFGDSPEAGFFGEQCNFSPGELTSSGNAPGSREGVFKAKHPSGAIGEFKFKAIAHGNNNVPLGDCFASTPAPGGPGFTTSGRPKAYVLSTLFYKSISGPGMSSRSWNISYAPSWSFAFECEGACQSAAQTTVTGSDGKVETYVFGNDFQSNAGQLLSHTISQGGLERRRVVNTYLDSAVGQPFPDYIGGYIGDSVSETLDNPLIRRNRPVKKVETYQDNSVFVSQVDTFDAFVRPTRVTKYSALGNSRSDVTEYHDDLFRWLLGQVRQQTNVDTGMILSRVEYNAESLPWKMYEFGKLRRTLSYFPDGALKTVADGNGNITTFAGWKRGVPQLVQHPPTAESPAGAIESAVVDDNGWMSSVTDENGYVTGYGYDPMGRLAGIIYPTGDGVAYSATSRSFRALTDVDSKPVGVVSGQWRLNEETGNHVKVTYMDAMWRPILVHEYDTGDMGTTLRASRTTYDGSGRVNFRSYPSSDPMPGASGIRTFYDVLDRVTRVEEDSELGVLASVTEYLPGLKTRVTNPRGFQTTTSFMAWDQPDYGLPTLSEQPEGTVIEIARHPQFGWSTQLTQRDASGSLQVSRQYVYDANAQLCKRIEPESGAALFDYDGVGNLSWSAEGQPLLSLSCDRASVPAAARTTRNYDARNRLLSVAAPNAPVTLYGYAADGALTTLVQGDSAWSYSYNKRRLLTREALSFGDIYSFNYSYNALGDLSAVSTPSGLSIDYAPNALGQPTKAGTFASGATYFPDGSLKQFSYGNGLIHSVTQNARHLPSQVRDASGSTVVHDFGYSYDANGNVTAINDVGQSGLQTRSLLYDARDRLVSATATQLWGVASYAYDPLDNLRLADQGSRQYRYQYDSNNRLTQLTDPAGAALPGLDFAYDTQGRQIRKGAQTRTFDGANRISAIDGETYAYDGAGRRIATWAADGRTKVEVYTQDGKLGFAVDSTKGGGSSFIYLAGQRIAQDHWVCPDQHTVTYFHADALGSPVATTDAAKNVLERTYYAPYGEALNRSVDGPGYTGHVMDAATGLVYAQQRYYDPVVGKFLSIDPVATDPNSGGNFNRYWYANNNPYKFTDPDGRLVFLAPLVFKAVVGFVAGAGFEITTQLASGKSLSEVDVSDVLVSGAVGAVLGGPIGAVAKAGTVAPKISTSVKAVKTLSDQASRARTAARLAKIESRIQGNAEKIMNQTGEVVVTASKAIAGVFVKNEAKDAANGTQAPTPTKEDAGSDQVPKQAERENNR